MATMGTLYLVRHGQASFGAADYDQLSDLGTRQCVRLGAYWHARGVRFDAALSGTLRRHTQSLAGLAQSLPGLPQPQAWPALDEYDSAALIRAIHPQPLAAPKSADEVRGHFRLLREALAAWMDGASQPQGMPTYTEFVAGIVGVLDHVRTQCAGNVVVVSSGGPICTAVGHVLGTAPRTTIELNLRIRNSSVTEFAFTPKRHVLVTYNTLPHLDQPELADWVTYA